ncbi:MAG: dienelactone hydrolase family protein [Acidimicrobiia bacterium]
MCFDLDSSPPIPHIHGGALSHEDLTLEARDGNVFASFAAEVSGDAAVVVLPDVRGLFRFYEELALRFAERGIDALAIDYFGRTAGVSKRPSDWDFWPEVDATTINGIEADVRAGVDYLRRNDQNKPVFVVGFCFGGSNAWHMAASNIGCSGVVGFYGHPDREDFPQGAPPVVSRVGDFTCPVLGLQGGDDPGIPAEVSRQFDDAMRRAGKTGEVVVYEGAPHSFFDRKYEEFAEQSADAWQRVLAFVHSNS